MGTLTRHQTRVALVLWELGVRIGEVDRGGSAGCKALMMDFQHNVDYFR